MTRMNADENQPFPISAHPRHLRSKAMKRWPTKPLGELVLPTEQRDPRLKPAEEFSYVDIAGVDNEAKALVTTKKIVGAEAPSRARKVIRKGDVIVSTVRPNLNAVALVPAALNNQICSTGFAVLRPSEKVLSGYLFAFTRSPFFIESLVARTTGANYPAVNDGEVKDVPIPVPPLSEQERIVKLLDEADALRKLRAQADRRTAALLPALFHEMFGDPTANPHGWSKTTLGELCELVNGAPFKPSDWDGAGLPIVRIQNLNDSTKPFNYTSKQLPEKFRVRPGDVLLSWSGTPGTSFGCFRWSGPEGWLNQHIFNVKLQPGLDGEFFIQSVNVRLGELIARAHGGVGLQHVTKGVLNAVEMLVPPLPLQQEFAQRVAEIRELEAGQAASRQRLKALFQSLLHRAFNGEL